MIEVEVPKGTVYLIPTVSVPMAAGLLAALEGTPATEGSMQASLVAGYLQPVPRGAIAGWTGDAFSEKGPDGLTAVVPVTDDNIARLLAWGSGGMEVAEKCNELYAGDLFRPLQLRRSKSLPPTPTEPSMSPTPEPGSEPRKPSKRSSPNGTAGMASVVPVR